MTGLLRGLMEGDSDDEDDDIIGNAEVGSGGCRGAINRAGLYLSFTKREMKRRKIGCCLGCCSCWLVVFCMSILVSLLDNVPAIFLRLAEVENGEVDLEVSPEALYGQTMNYNEVERVLAEIPGPPGHFSYHAPRMVHDTNQMWKLADCNVTDDLKLPSPDSGLYNASWAYQPGRGGHSYLDTVCKVGNKFTLYAVDTAREARMGYGRLWNYGPIPPGQIILDSALANNLQLVKGDPVVIRARVLPGLRAAFVAAGASATDVDTEGSALQYTNVVVTIFDIAHESYGKLPNDAESWAFVEYATAFTELARHLSPTVPDAFRQNVSQLDPYSYATQVALNVPPDRFEFYNSNNYDIIQRRVLTFAGQVMYQMGFLRFSSKLSLLNFMQETRFFSMFLGLIISIVGTILTLLSITLIYSLLMINVESRTFELGVLRMIGMHRHHVMQLVLTQSYFYAIPAWLLGLIMGQSAFALINLWLKDVLLVSLSLVLSPLGWTVATLLGLVIPALASVLPILSALGQNLQDSLDVHHSKTKAVEFQIERAEDTKISWPTVVSGSFLVSVGFLIYYVFPLSLLSFNITLLFYMFFGLLLCMLLGLILLSLNLENFLEAAATNLFFFWENAAIQSLVMKNLVSHRKRNRKTTIMYAISLAFVIWISVSFDSQMESFRYMMKRRFGTRLIVEGYIPYYLVVALERVFLKSPTVKTFTWLTVSLGSQDMNTALATTGRFRNRITSTVSVSPNFYDVVDQQFLTVAEHNTSLDMSVSAQMYTERGSRSLVVGSTFRTYMQLRGLDDQLVLQYFLPKGTEYNVLQPLAFLDASPVLAFSKFPSRLNQNTLLSIPSYVRLKRLMWPDFKVSDILWRRIMVDVGRASDADVQQLRYELQRAILSVGMDPNSFYIRDSDDAIRPVTKSNELFQLFFVVTTLIAMVMCFFSLMASMLTNIYEQSKEIGVIRALGLSRFAVIRLYIWEAFTLVTCASVMGLCIGTAIAWTMAVQRVLFTQLPIPLTFPYVLLGVIMVSAFITSIAASFYPTYSLVRKQPVEILRFQFR
eukprot:EG_transcript_1379